MPSLNFSLFNRKATKKNRDLREEQITSLVLNNSNNVSKYLEKYLNKFTLTLFPSKSEVKDDLKTNFVNLKVPIRNEDKEDFNSGKIRPEIIFENMAYYVGILPNDIYSKRYIEVINKIYANKACEVLYKKGKEHARNGDFFDAIITLRGALYLKPDYLESLYTYARTAREISKFGKDMSSKNSGSDEKPSLFNLFKKKENIPEEKIEKNKLMTDFEDEAMRVFKAITIVYPNYPEGYYFLGYLLINKSKYTDAVEAFKKYLKVSRNFKDKREIKRRIKQLTPTMNIEEGCKLVSKGNYEEGIKLLEKEIDSPYKTWPQLYFFLGLGYKGIRNKEKAKMYFKKALEIKPEYHDAKIEIDSLNKIEKY